MKQYHTIKVRPFHLYAFKLQSCKYFCEFAETVKFVSEKLPNCSFFYEAVLSWAFLLNIVNIPRLIIL